MTRVALAGALLLAVMLVSGCTLAEQLPTISAEPSQWNQADVPKRFSAVVDLKGASWEVLGVEVRFVRHRWPDAWPGPQTAHVLTASPDPQDASRFVAQVPNPGDFRGTQVVTYEWYLFYKLPDGAEEVTAKSGVRSLQVGCPHTGADPRTDPASGLNTFLSADQAAVLAALTSRMALLSIPDRVPGGPIDLTHTDLAALGLAPTHQFVSIVGLGVAFVDTTVGPVNPLGVLTGPPTSGQPGLLLFAPSSAATNITDPPGPDSPYALIGWAYGHLFNPDSQPTFGCVPWHEWFVHEAGWHLASDGGMRLTPPLPGQQMILAPPLTPLPALGDIWHPRLWDIHLWLNLTTGVPRLAILNPAGTPGGIAPPTMPAGAFFFPTYPP